MPPQLEQGAFKGPLLCLQDIHSTFLQLSHITALYSCICVPRIGDLSTKLPQLLHVIILFLRSVHAGLNFEHYRAILPGID